MIIGRLIFEDPKMLGATLLDSVLFERKKADTTFAEDGRFAGEATHGPVLW